ncbi:MAG: PhzF family isomerase [bacterium]|nr:PhzF family isomerase [bacterium]
MRRFTLYQVDSFTTTRLEGNPAGVVPNADGLSEGEMQQIARELNNSETAFVLSPTAPDHEMWIRFFTPSIEVPSCGHATVAAHYVRAIERELPSCTVMQRIGIGVLPVDIVQRDDDYTIMMTQGRPEFEEPLSSPVAESISSALGLGPTDLDPRCPIQVVSTGHSKVLVGINSRDTLNRLTPNQHSLTEISHEIGCNGYYVFVLDLEGEDVQAHGRMFAPAIGIAEDPVTGNANGPLGAYLVKHGLATTSDGRFAFRALQGEAMGRPGIVEVEVTADGGTPELVKIGGRAVIAFRTELELG